jgi:uncharacterized protein YukE
MKRKLKSLRDQLKAREREISVLEGALGGRSSAHFTKAKDRRNKEALSLARMFHDLYEQLAPEYGYETREETRVFNPFTKNGALTVRVCSEILAKTDLIPGPAVADLEKEKRRLAKCQSERGKLQVQNSKQADHIVELRNALDRAAKKIGKLETDLAMADSRAQKITDQCQVNMPELIKQAEQDAETIESLNQKIKEQGPQIHRMRADKHQNTSVGCFSLNGHRVKINRQFEKAKDAWGTFVGFGVEHECHEGNGCGPYTVALVMNDQGVVRSYSPGLVEFVNLKRG